MKNQLSYALRAAALMFGLILLPSFASAKSATATDRAKSALEQHGSLQVTSAGPYVEIGTYQIQVMVKLGEPNKKLTDGTWLYDGFNVDDSDASGLLAVRFDRGLVSSLTIVTPSVALAMGTPAKPATKSVLAANK